MDSDTTKKQQDEPILDDVVIESYDDDTIDDAGLGHSPEEKIKRLKADIKKLRQEKAEFLDGWQRLKADFSNYRKREDEEKSSFIKFAREGLITDILPVLESFHMAFSNKESWEKVDKNWRVGVEYIHTQLKRILEDSGLKDVSPLGEQFDPNLHSSVGNVETDDEKKYHTVAEVVSPGYKVEEKLIKAPQVRVYVAREEAKPE